MILGTYWYFGFPEGLYTYEYFEFRKGLGGFADNPAELITVIESDQSERIIADLQSLIDRYSEGFIYVYKQENKLKIGTGAHHLFDYDFLLMLEVEKVLKNYKVTLTSDRSFTNSTLIKLHKSKSAGSGFYPSNKFMKIVGSNLKIHNAENLKLRLDSNLPSEYKAGFISALRKVAEEESLEVFFYYEKEFNDKTNLMLFFTNGRQGLGLKSKRFVDTASLESKIELAVQLYNANLGHVGGFDFHPQNGLHIEMIIEEEFIL